MMFGFACRDTKNLMPLPITMAHRLAQSVDQAASKNSPYLRPDGKTQVTIEYKNGLPTKFYKSLLLFP